MRLPTAAALLLCFAAPAFAAGEVYKWTDDKGVVQYTDTPPDGREFTRLSAPKPRPDPAPEPAPEAAAAPASTPAPPPGSAIANCESAKRNVENITRFTDISMDRDGDGTPEKLTEDERAKELERNQALVKLYCPEDEAAPAGE